MLVGTDDCVRVVLTFIETTFNINQKVNDPSDKSFGNSRLLY